MGRIRAVSLAALFLVAVAPALAQEATPVAASAEAARITGSVTYRERIALTPGAIVEVFLDDVSRADVAVSSIATLRMTEPGQVPVRFTLAYDPLRIDPTHRYAIRARIIEDGQLSFTTSDNVPVITQEHGTSVALVLRRVPRVPTAAPPPAASKPAGPSTAVAAVAPKPAAPARPVSTLPPPVALANLPATFTGTIPCADCNGIRYTLNLFADDAYVLKMLYVGRPSPNSQDEIGSWALSSDRRAIALKSSSGLMQFFAIRDGVTLRKLDIDGGEIASTLQYSLRRATALQPLDVRVPLRGSYRPGGPFVECSTGRPWTVARGDAAEALDAVYQSSARKTGDGLVVSLDGRLTGEDALVVLGDVKAWPNETCPSRFAAATLENTQWRLTRVGSANVPAATRPASEPGLSFRLEPKSFSGSDGCNRLAGNYERTGDALTLTAVGTLMACQGGETRLASVLKDVRNYRVLGTVLDLYDADRRVVARFQAAR